MLIGDRPHAISTCDSIANMSRTGQSSEMRLAVAFISMLALTGCELRGGPAQDDGCDINVPIGWFRMSRDAPVFRQAIRTTYVEGHYVWGKNPVSLRKIGVYLETLKSFNLPPLLQVEVHPPDCDEVARLIDTVNKSGYCSDYNCALVAAR